MAATDDKKIVSLAEAKTQKTAAFNRTTYGEVIRANRIKMGLSQPDLAAILGTSKNYVSNWEVGRTRPDMNMIPAICRAIGISIAEFFGGHSELDDLSPEQRAHIRSYSLLNTRDQAAVNALTDHLLNMEDTEFRQRCQAGFAHIFHNENLAAAGSMNMLGDTVDGEKEFIRLDEITERADEIITVTGDSMEPTLHAGDDLLIEHTETLEPGEIGIFVINGEGFVKEYRSNGVYSHNEAKYPFRKFCSGDDVRIVGRVLGKVTKAHRPTREESIVLDELLHDGVF